MANDTVGRTVGVAFAVCLVCSVLVSAAVVSLRPQQAANKALDRKRNILMAAGLLQEGGEVDQLYRRIKPRVIDLTSGKVAAEVDPESYDQRKATKDPAMSAPVPADQDVASLKRRARYAPVYLVQGEGRVEQVILPISGLGLWSTLHGFVALDAGDLTTIKGLVFYEHAETPGLGGEVDNPAWKALWKGKQAFDETGRVRIEVIKGQVDPARPDARYQVDGLSGATLTSRGVEYMLHFWLGANGFGPFLARVKAEGV